MTLLWKADFSKLNDSAQAGFTNTHRQSYTGGIVTNGAPVPAFSHPKLGNSLVHKLESDGYRLEALPREASNLTEGVERYIRFDFAVPSDFPVNQQNYFLCINQVHSANPSTSPPLEFDIYNGGLYTRGYNWVAKVPNQIRHRLTSVVPGEVYSVVYYIKLSDNADENRISVWVNGRPVLENLKPGYPLIDPAKSASYWKGSTLYAHRDIQRPLTVYQSNHMIGTELKDVLVVTDPGPVEVEPDPFPTGDSSMPEDFAYTEVQISPTADFKHFTVIDTFTGMASTVATDLTYGDHYWTRFVAVDWSGNRSEPSEATAAKPEKLVNIDLGPDAVDRFNVRKAAIGSAEIDNLAVNDAHIANLNVGKLTTGALNAATITLIDNGRLATSPDTNNRITLDRQGLYSFVNGELKLWLRNDGDALFTGRIQSRTSGVRWEGRPEGDFRFYKANNTDFAQMIWEESNNRLVVRGPLTGLGWDGSDVNSGWLHLHKDYARLAWGRSADVRTSIEANNVSAGIRSSIVSCHLDGRLNEHGGQDRAYWMFVNNRGQNTSLLHLEAHLQDGNQFCTMFRNPGGNSGVMFGFNRIQCKNYDGEFIRFECDRIVANSAHFNNGPATSGSSWKLKTRISEPRFGAYSSARDMLSDIRVQQYWYKRDEYGPKHIGWIAEDVLEVAPELVVYRDGVPALSSDVLGGFAVRLGEENSDAIDDLQRQINELKDRVG